MADFKYEIEESINVLSINGNWQTELNLISWNGAPAKYDIRKWMGDHERMGKGISLSKDELIALRDAINEYLNE